MARRLHDDEFRSSILCSLGKAHPDLWIGAISCAIAHPAPEVWSLGGDRRTGGATSLLILCLPQKLRNCGRCANLGRADTHRCGEGGNASAFAPSVPLSGLPVFHGPFPRSERRICDTRRSTIRRHSTAAASPTNVVCSVFSSGHAFHCIACTLRRESCSFWSNQSVRLKPLEGFQTPIGVAMVSEVYAHEDIYLGFW